MLGQGPLVPDAVQHPGHARCLDYRDPNLDYRPAEDILQVAWNTLYSRALLGLGG
jgi:hypothetical protein